MKCCDTCKFFQLAPKPNDAGKRCGYCQAPIPVWAEVLLNACGPAAAEVQVDSGTNCDAYQ